MRSRRSSATVSKALLIMGYSSSTSLKLSTDSEYSRHLQLVLTSSVEDADDAVLDEIHLLADGPLFDDVVSRLEDLEVQFGQHGGDKVRIGVCEKRHGGHQFATESAPQRANTDLFLVLPPGGVQRLNECGCMPHKHGKAGSAHNHAEDGPHRLLRPLTTILFLVTQQSGGKSCSMGTRNCRQPSQ
ncbi:hypothetical protein EYF80_007620 [Liparis tanakae]|uniref:Uncharacterized protein n=1 Tax=Liparis tanakae TaxID=230148 RepID=A0A4Z2IWP7_9TELE|nr:hypothetical protein EYF80_007620 [Liparis tanakae]